MINDDQLDTRLKELAKKMGSDKRVSVLMSVLGKSRSFMNALETPVGQELLKCAVSAIEEKIELILAEKDTQKDRAELQAYMSILRRWQDIINTFNKNDNTFRTL